MSKPWPNAADPENPTVDEMFDYVQDVWRTYTGLPFWAGLYQRGVDSVIEVMADTGSTIMAAAGALYVLGLEGNDEGPERWLAIGFEMLRRYSLALKAAAAAGVTMVVLDMGPSEDGLCVGPDGRLTKVVPS